MKLLISYSSGFGSTREVAEKISEILAQKDNFSVEVQSIDNVGSITDYDGLVVGTSVRADRPLANVRDFFATHKKELETKKLALFAVCLSANNQEGRERVIQDYLAQIVTRYPQIQFVSVEAFGGKIDFDKLNPVMKSLMKRVLQKTGLPSEGSIDTRDWDIIGEWAKQLTDKFSQNGTL